MDRQFCVYTHKKPNGDPFYIGKGLVSRAYDFASSRRTEWHKNIVKKYGRTNILIEIILCDSEEQAFLLEKQKIKLARSMGFPLVNLTDGGEGTSGLKPNEQQIAGLAKGRRVGKKGPKGPRPHLEDWIRSDAGKEHVKKLSEIGREILHRERKVVCCECGVEFVTRSAKAKSCSRLCEQRNRRARQKDATDQSS
jgi:hypothetical protein